MNWIYQSTCEYIQSSTVVIWKKNYGFSSDQQDQSSLNEEQDKYEIEYVEDKRKNGQEYLAWWKEYTMPTRKPKEHLSGISFVLQK